MYFVVAADTDVGTVKTTNQDSVCVKIAETPYGQTALAIETAIPTFAFTRIVGKVAGSRVGSVSVLS